MKENKKTKKCDCKKTKFKATASYNGKSIEITDEIDGNFNDITYDEVIELFMEQLEHMFPYDLCGDIDEKYFILDGKNWYPVVSESDEEKIKKIKGSKKYEKFLVLPDAEYVVSREYRLFSKMIEDGIIDEDSEFDYGKYHSIIENIEKEDK